MPPSKRKGTLRRQVLDLKGEDSPSRSTWQNKYQFIQSSDEVQQNGEYHLKSSGISSPKNYSAKTNPLSGLVGNYNSDSDSEEGSPKAQNNLDAKVEDFLKEIQSISRESNTPLDAGDAPSTQNQQQEPSSQASSASLWQQCYDPNSGYPYYWNVETNEVTWEMPAELKMAIESAVQQQKQQQQQHQNTEHHHPPKQKPPQESKKDKGRKDAVVKSVLKYPWQTESDSEDEKIEMITSFGPQSGEESEDETSSLSKAKVRSENSKRSWKNDVIGPQLPIGPTFPRNSKRRSDSDDMDGESFIDSSYETSSLLTYRVQDTGPPGDDNFAVEKEAKSHSEKTDILSTHSDVPSVCANKSLESVSNRESRQTKEKSESSLPNSDSISSKVRDSAIRGNTAGGSETDGAISPKSQEKISKESCLEFADNVIAEIEKETPPDNEDVKSQMESSVETRRLESIKSNYSQDGAPKADSIRATGISGFALLANYEDDSESEEGSVNERRKPQEKDPVKAIFPVEIPEEKTVKPLFPCMSADSGNLVAENSAKETMQLEKRPAEVDSSGGFGSEIPVTDSGLMHKAFKRKKRIEFATTSRGMGSSSEVAKYSSPECSSVSGTTQYNMDPSCNDHRGFGFNSYVQTEPNKRGPKYQSGWINFVKTETINFDEQCVQQKAEAQVEPEVKPENSEQCTATNEEIEDSALLLKEKVRFLTEATDEISPVQHMAIELETLFVAWQQGALSKVYFARWVREKCSDIIRHEKSAAPSGWTCLWDRKSKRYFYRNAITKVVQWDYPNVEEDPSTSAATNPATKSTRDVDAEGGGEEMELCFTPPHQVSEEEKVIGDHPKTPPPPLISERLEGTSSPAALSSPTQTVSEVEASDGIKAARRKKQDASYSADEAELSNSSVANPTTAVVHGEDAKEEKAPPLPPMPPPPPPPPDEPPPPLPNSPPPLPLDPDQPLPPGVDEPEYSMFRRLSPKQSFKKSQPDASTYANDVIMTYGYAVPVQSVTPACNQSVPSISMQPVEYHGFVHDPLAKNHYVIQSTPSAHVIHCPAKKSKLSLSSELDSFYSDIAALDSGTKESVAEKPPETVSSHDPPVRGSAPQFAHNTHSSTSNVANATTKQADTLPANGIAAKKKKKTKLTPALSMKKKGVSSLVAKWQQVQQEVRRDLNSDDDDDDNN